MTATVVQTGAVIPSVTYAALGAIQDPNTQAVLQQLVTGWNTRNGQTGNGDNAFVTRADLGLATSANGTIGGLSFNPASGASASGSTPAAIAALLAGIQISLFADPFFQSLGTKISLIDTNLSDLGIAATEAMISAQQAGEGVITETTARTTADQALEETMTTQYAQMNGNIAALQTSVSTTATSVSALTTSTSQQFATVNGNIAALTSTVTTNASTVEALTTSTSTQFSQVNQNIGAIEQTLSTTANSVAAQAQEISTLQSSVGAQTASLQTEANTRASADGALQAQYSVKVDLNGYVAGYGLSSTANNAAPFSEFIVRADRFAIASPSGPNVAPSTPFVVYTTPQSAGGVTIQPGVYINSATIAAASIGTLMLGGNAVTIPLYSEDDTLYTGSGAWATTMDYTFSVPYATTLAVFFAAKFGYPGGPTTNGLQMYIDGTYLNDNGGTEMIDYPNLIGMISVGAGQHTFEVHWMGGDSNIQLTRQRVVIMGVMR